VSVSHAWRALRHRNFKLYFLGQSVSLIGTWMTRLATTWLVYRLTHSAFLLGVVGFAGQILSFALAPLAGVWVERLDRRRLLVWTQVAAGLQSLAMAALTLAGIINLTEIIALAALQGVINAFDMPARQSFLGQMIEDRADLPNAIALNSSMVNGARLAGPVFAAVLVDLFGEGWCFAIDSASYIAVIVSLMAMTVAKRPHKPRSGHVWHEMAEGMRYVIREPTVRGVLLLLAATSVLGGAYSTLLPLIAGETLNGGPHTLGMLMAAAGLGALLGALYLAARETVTGLPAVIGYATTALGLGLVGLWWASSVWAAIPLAFVCGLGFMVQMASTNTIIQTVVDPNMLGRVMSLYGMAFFSGMPVGAVIQGSLADAIGPQPTLLIMGGAVLACAVAYRFAMPHVAGPPALVADGEVAEAP
jgi:MFS family permease